MIRNKIEKLQSILVIHFIFILLISCADETVKNKNSLNKIAEEYVKVVLEYSLYDSDYIDAFYGPKEWVPEKNDSAKTQIPCADLKKKINRLMKELAGVLFEAFDKLWKLRYVHLKEQIKALDSRIDILSGLEMTFDEESKALYGVVAREFDMNEAKNIIAAIDEELPGTDELYKRYSDFMANIIIPAEKIDTVFKNALFECRKRTLQHTSLDQGDSFKVEYVTDKPWRAANWYKGDAHSVIQLNTDVPLTIHAILSLASHEAYPGHHLQTSLLEQNLHIKCN